MSFRHPSDEAIALWLSGGETDTKVDNHLCSCERCAAVVEELASGAAPISEALAVALAPPPDLTDRLEQRVAAKLSSRQIMNVVADLFGAGFETTRLLFIEDDNDDD